MKDVNNLERGDLVEVWYGKYDIYTAYFIRYVKHNLNFKGNKKCVVKILCSIKESVIDVDRIEV